MNNSQSNATAAALTQVGIRYTTRVQVISTERGMPAFGALKRGDIITKVNGVPIDSVTGLSREIRAQGVGRPLRLTVIRNGSTQLHSVTAVRSQGHPVIGVVVTVQFHFPLTVNISVGNIGGPSAGLMFALGIVDKLTPMNLTGGRFVAGTGEITPAGAGQGGDGLPGPGGQLRGRPGRGAGRHATGPSEHAGRSGARPGGAQGGPLGAGLLMAGRDRAGPGLAAG
jgi:PDZ domain-containing protein